MNQTTRSNKPQKIFNQSKNLIRASYFAVTSLTLFAWNKNFNGDLSGFSIPSLLAILAFGYMWIHYFSGYLKANYEPELNTKLSLKISQYFVLCAIIAHPIFIISHLNRTGHGLPPDSFKNFFGLTGMLFISLGTISLLAFLAFEFKKQLQQKPKIWRAVLSLNDLAMLLVLIHGFKLGFVIKSGFFRYIWLFYGLSLLYFYYDKYINKGLIKKYAEGFIVALIIWMLLFLSLGIVRNQPGVQSNPNSQNTDQSSKLNPDEDEGSISLAQLSKADGLEGHKCWVAVNGKVYDTTNNPQWKNGEHTPSQGQAKCGKDLTQVISQSPHGTSVLGSLKQIGELRTN